MPRRLANSTAASKSLNTQRNRWDVPQGRAVSLWQGLTPPQIFVSSFLLLIAIGTCGLRWLPGLYVGSGLGWIDSFFTATSAVCVTGLIVVDTATYFTPAGQAFILSLIQFGGLGMLAFSSLIIIALGKRLSLRTEILTSGTLDSGPLIDSKRLAIDIVRFSVAIEGLGALALYCIWGPNLGWKEAAWPSVFHSVSGFCNAGFSTFSNSLIGFQNSPTTLVILGLLIVAGGIGFLTMEEVYLHLISQRWRRNNRLSLHSKLVLVTSCLLLIGGAAIFFACERDASLVDLSLKDRFCNSLFMSITARTAGFNSIDYSQATDSANFLTILLMLIGGSPGSTAGGLKTTTFALIGLLAWSRMKSEEKAYFSGRSIPDETIQRAVGLMVAYVAVVALGVFVLSGTDPLPGKHNAFLARLFEVASAFGTVGLSMNLTPELSEAGRLAIALMMFLGRVGPLTLAAAFVIRKPKISQFRFAYEDVVVG